MKKKRKNYIDEWMEWQENQYNLGHYIGHVGPFAGFNPGKPKIVGIVFNIIPGFIAFEIACWMYNEYRLSDDIDALIIGFFFLILSLTAFWIGYRYIQKGNKMKPNRKVKKYR